MKVRAMNWKTFYLMVISTLAFAFVNAIIKYLDSFSAYQLVFFRCAVSLVISLIQLKIVGVKPWGNNKPILFLRGLSGVTALFMGFVLIKNVPLGTAVMLNYLSPIFTAFIAVYWLKEKVNFKQWLFLLLCVVGVYLMKTGTLSLTTEMLLLGLGSSALAGLAYNCVRVCKDTDHPLVVVLYFPLVGTPVAFTVAMLFGGWVWPRGVEWLFILLVGALTQVAQIALTKALQSDKAANVSILKYLGVLHAFIFGLIVFEEQVNFLTAMGAVTVVVGIVLFTLFKTKGAVKN